MNNEYTHIAMIIDRSGSMVNCWSDVSSGYTQIVKDNKEEAGKCTFTVAAFDTEYTLIEDFTDIKDVNETLSVSPRGFTALLDAIGKTITSVGEKLAKMKESNRPSKVMIIIQTDGHENASKEFTKESIKKLIDEQTNKYNWQFQFIGADLTSVNEAKSWGIKGSNTSTYRVDNSLDTFNLLSSKMKSARSAVDMATYSAAMAFTDSDREILNEKKDTVKAK
jgi:uncharacterized protein YegL